jgi:hypothetical protein
MCTAFDWPSSPRPPLLSLGRLGKGRLAVSGRAWEDRHSMPLQIGRVGTRLWARHDQRMRGRLADLMHLLERAGGLYVGGIMKPAWAGFEEEPTERGTIELFLRQYAL